jgi:hypothetical protein
MDIDPESDLEQDEAECPPPHPDAVEEDEFLERFALDDNDMETYEVTAWEKIDVLIAEKARGT